MSAAGRQFAGVPPLLAVEAVRRRFVPEFPEGPYDLQKCIEVSVELGCLGLETVRGHYLGPEVRKPTWKRGGSDYARPPYGHWWAVAQDGTIVDATADQFGDREAVRLVGPDDPRQAYYWEEVGEELPSGFYRSRPRLDPVGTARVLSRRQGGGPSAGSRAGR